MKIIPIFFYHEKWAVIMRKFVYSPDGVEKMGPLRGDGNLAFLLGQSVSRNGREDGSPSWGRKRQRADSSHDGTGGREDGSPSWGRKPISELRNRRKRKR